MRAFLRPHPQLPKVTVVTMKSPMSTQQLDTSRPSGMELAGMKIRLAFAALLLGSCSGCYDGEELVTQARSAALNTRLAEVDFGTFHTSLPRDPKSGSITELSLHVFGTVPHYRVAAIERQLKTDEYRVRHETLAALRGATREELAEPSLTSLRTRIEHIVNSILDEAPIKGVGFYKVTIRQM
jgi:hypothetical protein